MRKNLKQNVRIFFLFSVIITLSFFQAHGKVEIDVSKNAQDMILFGAEFSDGLGYPVFAEDINGDGLKDIMVSATASDGPDQNDVNCGAIYVVFGKDPMPASALITAVADLTIYGAEHGIWGIEGDEAGYALASADLNNDGLNDIITSSLYADGPDNTRPNSGEVYVIYGRYDYPEDMDLSVDADITIYGAEGGDPENTSDPDDPDEGDIAGFSLATGDLNNDGWIDLIIGAVTGDGPQNTRPHSGEIYIIWGDENLPSIIDLASSADVTTIWGAEAGDYSGFALFVKDLDGDNIDDLLIGAIGADGPSNSRESSGEVYCINGRVLFPSTLDLATDADVTIYGAEAGDQGFNPVNYVNSADINGDGLNDLIIGAPFADGEMNAMIESGETYIVLGTGSLPQSIDLSTDADIVIYGIDEYDHSGFSVATGDINDDNIDDIVISAVDADGVFNVKTSSGEAYVIYGREQFDSDLNLSDADVLISGADPYDLLGVSTYIEDVNNDGINDILIGVPASNGIDNLTDFAGEAIIIFGVKDKIGLEALSPKDGEVIACEPVFTWTPGRPNNIIWAFQLFEAPDASLILHSSPFLLGPTYTLPDNFLMEIPADKILYWRVYGTNPLEIPIKIESSQVFSFTREGLHLLSPEDSVSSSSPLTLEWTHGCPDNDSWVVGISDDPNYTNFIAISPILDNTSWTIPDTIWQTLPTGIPLYWKVLGYYQPVVWRVSLDWAQEEWSFIKN
jgi:hypothetical protein